MLDDGQERLAANEATCREINESIQAGRRTLDEVVERAGAQRRGGVPITVQLVPLLAFSAPAVPGSVPLVRGRLVAFAAEHGAGRELQAAIGAAVSEASANAVVHAYRERDAPGPVHVEDGDLEIVIADDGDGFRPGPAPGIGAGLSIVARSADGYAIRERIAGGGVELWMRFRLAA